MSARLLPRRRRARPSDALPQGEPWWVGPAFIGFSLLVCMLLAQTALGAPLRTHKPASDIRWYRVTDVGNRLVGARGKLYALDPLSGQNIWETEKLKGATVAVEPVCERDLVLLVTVAD